MQRTTCKENIISNPHYSVLSLTVKPTISFSGKKLQALKKKEKKRQWCSNENKIILITFTHDIWLSQKASSPSFVLFLQENEAWLRVNKKWSKMAAFPNKLPDDNKKWSTRHHFNNTQNGHCTCVTLKKKKKRKLPLWKALTLSCPYQNPYPLCHKCSHN